MDLIPVRDSKTSYRVFDVMKELHKRRIGFEFVGTERRFKAADIAFVITEEDKDIGFLYLTNEGKQGMYFLDICILREYRGRGIGYEAIKELLKRYNNAAIKNFVIAEFESDNISCLNVMKKLGGIKVSEKHFLIQPERLKEFREFIINDSVDLMVKAPELKEIVEAIHAKNGDNKNPKVKKLGQMKSDV